MLTAKGEEVDRIIGLESGATYYMTKPFSSKELIARIKAVLKKNGRKNNNGNSPSISAICSSIWKPTALQKGKTPLELSATEFKLLVYLVERKGKLYSREQLVDAVWKGEAFIEPRTVDNR